MLRRTSTPIIPSKLSLVNYTVIRDDARARLPDLSPEVDYYIDYVETTAAKMPPVALPPLTEEDPNLPPFMWIWLNEGIESGHIPPQQDISRTNEVPPRKRKRLATGPPEVSQKRVRTTKTQPPNVVASNVLPNTNSDQGSSNGRPHSGGRSETRGQTRTPAATLPPPSIDPRASAAAAPFFPLHVPPVSMHWVQLPTLLPTAAPRTSTVPLLIPSNQRAPRRI